MTDQAAAEGRRTEYTVGDRVYRIAAFKGSKGVRAFAVVSRIGERWDAILENDARFRTKYRELNVTTITRDMAAMRVQESQGAIAALEAEVKVPLERDPGETDERLAEREAERLRAVEQLITANELRRDDWSRTLAGPLAESEEVRLPNEPSEEARFLATFPKAWEVAEAEMTMLVGLALIPDADLKAARDEGGPEAAERAIAALGLAALDDLYMDEIAELTLATVEVGLERARQSLGGLGNRFAALRRTLTRRGAAEPQKPEIPEPKVGTYVGREEEPTARQPGNGDSSTASPEPTAGVPSGPSTASSGAT